MASTHSLRDEYGSGDRADPEGGREPDSLKELVEVIVRAIVDYPDDVRVREIHGQQSTVIELEVSQADLGKVIGRGGRTASAIRTILFATGKKNKRRVVLEILE